MFDCCHNRITIGIHFYKYIEIYLFSYFDATTAVALWARAFASKAEGWVFEFQPRQT